VVNRFIGLLLILFSHTALALDLELTQGINSAYPIGIEAFGDNEKAMEVKSVVAHDLAFSGQFKLITQPAVIGSGDVSIEKWRYAGADSVVTGDVTRDANGQYTVRCELLNAAAKGRVLFSETYQVQSNELRALAHHISDEVYKKLTGVRGVFSTRIAYVLVQEQNTRYALEIADADGHNPQSLLVSSSPIMSPSWSPDGRQIAYVSFEKERAQIYTVVVASGKRRLITAFPGINGAPAWSPSGDELAVVLSKSGSPKIYSVSLATGALKQLTFGNAIDTEPRYAPDGKSLLFTSGRGGAPQIYRLGLSDGHVNRVSFDGNYNARASYTPNEKQIVLLHRDDNRQYTIGIQNIGSNRIMPLTHSTLDESPTVSPNGKLVLYATRKDNKGVLGMVSTDGRIRLNLPSPEGDAQEPAWSPYL